MAEMIFNAPFVSVDFGSGAVDLSASIEEAKLELSQESKDLILASTDPDALPTRRRLAGIEDLKLSGSFAQNAASGSVDLTMLACRGKNDLVIVFKRQNDTISVTNPSFTFTAVRTSPVTIGGKVGDIPMTPFEFSQSGGALVIDSTP